MGWAWPDPAAAQQATAIRLYAPVVDQFPQMSLFVGVTDEDGMRLAGLPAGSFGILEDGNLIPDVQAQEVETGTRQVFVINTSPGMRVRDSQGRSRLDFVRQALLGWWQLPAAASFGVDDLSLVSTDGALVEHSPSAASLASSLDDLELAGEGEIADLDLLLQALGFVSDPPPEPGTSSFLVFITPTITAGPETPVMEAIARANETGTALYPVLVGPPEAADLPETASLRQLAEQTNGRFTLFDPAAGLIPLAEQILSQRTQYRLSYTSSINASGDHSLQVRLTTGQGEILSAPVQFHVEVRPPDVAFISPPSQIERRSDDPALSLEALPPTSQPLRLLITFPDGHPRPITGSQLVVDGQVVLERVRPSFESFDWDLSAYVQGGNHTLRALVVDSLGLQGTSSDIPVYVEVVPPPRGLAALRIALGPLTAALAILISGIVLAIALVSLGRQRARPARAPVTPVTNRGGQLKRAGMMQPPTSMSPDACLLRLDPASQEGQPIPLTGGDLTLGRDPSLAAVVLEDPSVAGMHARIIRQAGGDYLVRDQGSVAGTWVNYEPVPTQGRRLRHGDLIHLGRVAFRFRLTAAALTPDILIRPAPSPSTLQRPPEPGTSSPGRAGSSPFAETRPHKRASDKDRPVRRPRRNQEPKP
jgi:CBS domain-containing protein